MDRSSAVQWAADTAGTSVEDVRVDHAGRNVAVAEQLLDGPDVVSVFEDRGREVGASGFHSRRAPPCRCLDRE